MAPPAAREPPGAPSLLPGLLEEVRRAADPSGFVAFDRFMDLALYASGLGFYARAPPPFGPHGDFYTAPRVHPIFGRTLAGRIAQLHREMGPDRPFRLVELGPGDGTLAASILEALDQPSPGSPSLEYVLVDRSPALLRAAADRLEPFRRSHGFAIRETESLGALGPFEGVVIANEVLDAQPVRRLRWTGDGWRELGVRLEGDRWIAAEAPLRAPVPGSPLDAPPEAGGIVEVAPLAEAIVREVADHLVRGTAIFLDYGMEERELVHAHPYGTLAAVRGHRFVEDPLERPGESDLSTFVNFTRIRAAARRAGLRERSYLSQAEALGAWGFQRLFEQEVRAAGSPENEVRLRLAVKNLLFGFERFRVLELDAPGGPAGPPTPT